MESLTWEERQKFDRLLAETRHAINFNDGGWVIKHPIREQLTDTLFNCPVAWSRKDPGVRGTFYLNEDGTIGEEYTES